MSKPNDGEYVCDMARVYMFYGDCPYCIHRYQPTDNCPHARPDDELDSGGEQHCWGFEDNSFPKNRQPGAVT